MDDERNQTIYKLWAPIYDKVMGPFAGKARRHAIELLKLHRVKVCCSPAWAPAWICRTFKRV